MLPVSVVCYLSFSETEVSVTDVAAQLKGEGEAMCKRNRQPVPVFLCVGLWRFCQAARAQRSLP